MPSSHIDRIPFSVATWLIASREARSAASASISPFISSSWKTPMRPL